MREINVLKNNQRNANTCSKIIVIKEVTPIFTVHFSYNKQVKLFNRQLFLMRTVKPRA